MIIWNIDLKSDIHTKHTKDIMYEFHIHCLYTEE